MNELSISSETVDIISNGYWLICNEQFDRDVQTSNAMQREQRGNCFTLSEYICNELIANEQVLASGICIEVLPSRRNYHASSWAVMKRSLLVARLDLLSDHVVNQPHLDELVDDFIGVTENPDEALYITTTTADNVTKSIATRTPITRPYSWPNIENSYDSVYVGIPLGIKTLHGLARHGGIHHLLDPAVLDGKSFPSLPR